MLQNGGLGKFKCCKMVVWESLNAVKWWFGKV